MWTEVWIGVSIAAMVMAAGWSAMRFARLCWAQVPAWLPEQLRGDTLAYAERVFRTAEPPLVVARVDRAYRGKYGLVTLVELKSRGEVRIYASDIIELSAQRLALSSETGAPVSTAAFVAVESHGRREALPVSLMTAGEVQALARRREDLLAGRLVPRHASHPGLCAGCHWRTRCWPEAPGREARGLSRKAVGRTVRPRRSQIVTSRPR